jgi:D-beta-D-heptose 7-phosphate kinase/D-beta-D-heptose 1-phosphate adenosyltransferase
VGTIERDPKNAVVTSSILYTTHPQLGDPRDPRERRENWGRMVFVNGYFDILHPGHIEFLIKAKSYGDTLLVGVNDSSTKRLAPITLPVEERMRLVLGVKGVDGVISFQEPHPNCIILRVAPSVIVKDSDYLGTPIPEISAAKDYRIPIIFLPRNSSYSSSNIKSKIIKDYLASI